LLGLVFNVKVRFLGTNGWYSTNFGNTSCVLIESERFYVVLDAGDGIYKLDKYVLTEKPVHLFLSHLHFDHIIGFHLFGKFRFKKAVNVYGFKGVSDGLQIVKHPYTLPFADLPFPVEIHELEEGSYSLPFPFVCKLLLHSDPCLGYRFELDGHVIAYCTDTGVCDSLRELANKADLLITESSLKPGQRLENWGHLDPWEAADIAKQAEVKQLFLTHFDAGNYVSLEDRREAETAAKAIFKNTTCAYDDFEVEL
jgi:ribonuclease BN (tRNA processing enzyme)